MSKALKQHDGEISVIKAFVPIAFFFGLLIYGLLIHPLFLGGERLPVEVLVLMAFCFNVAYLSYWGYNWDDIMDKIISKVGESIPVLLILFSVGVLIGSWIVCGTIPMLIYHGISWINPQFIYVYSFFICIIFSLLTGTSWGSAGTIGIVMLGIAQVYGADLAIVAAAIVGGSFFGDKMSPLSDTTNIAALATDVRVGEHIQSMMYTTIPSAIIAAIAYWALSFQMEIKEATDPAMMQQVDETLRDLRSIFRFSPILLLPLVVVIWGSVTRKPIVMTLLGAAWLAMILAFSIQDFSLNDIFQSFNKGFSVEMAGAANVQSNVVQILNRGGLYNLIDGIVISLLIFAFIGTLDVIKAIDVCIEKIMKNVRSGRKLVITALSTTLLTNITTSNQYATSFIIGAAFVPRFNLLGIHRKVLSRSLEDAGTMMENLFPWTPSGIFMASALGVSAIEYGPWQFLSLINIVVAYFFAFTGMAVFKYQNVPVSYSNNDHASSEH